MPLSRKRSSLVIVTPYLAQANNGNWRTASRWAKLLARSHVPILLASHQAVPKDAIEAGAAMIALHARRSYGAIAAWRTEDSDSALVVALTGTDLYRDLPAGNADARAALDAADALIVLQDDALRHLPRRARRKAFVVYQSAQALPPLRKPRGRLDCVLVAHLREEKDPRTVFEAWQRLPPDLPAALTIVGAPLDPALGAAAQTLARADARVRYAGARSHAWTRHAIRRAHFLIVPSRMEGGSNVVVEALTSGTPILASRMSGNLGMLGRDYRGYFRVGDPVGLARLVKRALRDREFRRTLGTQCRRLAPRHQPAAERAALEEALRYATGDAILRGIQTIQDLYHDFALGHYR